MERNVFVMERWVTARRGIEGWLVDSLIIIDIALPNALRPKVAYLSKTMGPKVAYLSKTMGPKVAYLSKTLKC